MGEVKTSALESVRNAIPGNPQQGQTCENCAGPIPEGERRGSPRRFCSTRCRALAHRKRVARRCPVCGQDRSP